MWHSTSSLGTWNAHEMMAMLLYPHRGTRTCQLPSTATPHTAYFPSYLVEPLFGLRLRLHAFAIVLVHANGKWSKGGPGIQSGSTTFGTILPPPRHLSGGSRNTKTCQNLAKVVPDWVPTGFPPRIHFLRPISKIRPSPHPVLSQIRATQRIPHTLSPELSRQWSSAETGMPRATETGPQKLSGLGAKWRKLRCRTVLYIIVSEVWWVTSSYVDYSISWSKWQSKWISVNLSNSIPALYWSSLIMFDPLMASAWCASASKLRVGPQWRKETTSCLWQWAKHGWEKALYGKGCKSISTCSVGGNSALTQQPDTSREHRKKRTMGARKKMVTSLARNNLE